jgi:hypothetical protein
MDGPGNKKAQGMRTDLKLRGATATKLVAGKDGIPSRYVLKSLAQTYSRLAYGSNFPAGWENYQSVPIVPPATSPGLAPTRITMRADATDEHCYCVVGNVACRCRISDQPALVEALLALVVFRLTTPPTHRHFSSALGQRNNGKSLDPRRGRISRPRRERLMQETGEDS